MEHKISEVKTRFKSCVTTFRDLKNTDTLKLQEELYPPPLKHTQHDAAMSNFGKDRNDCYATKWLTFITLPQQLIPNY